MPDPDNVAVLELDTLDALSRIPDIGTVKAAFVPQENLVVLALYGKMVGRNRVVCQRDFVRGVSSETKAGSIKEHFAKFFASFSYDKFIHSGAFTA
jgi:hypothetical protein